MFKMFLSLFLLLLVAQIGAQDPFVCGVPERKLEPVTSEAIEKMVLATPPGLLCSEFFVQVDYDIVQDKGLEGARAFIKDLTAQWAVPYLWIDVELNFTYEFLTAPTYTDGNSYEMLQQFQSSADANGADAAMMLSYKSSGGIAWVDQSCRPNSGYKYSFSNIKPSHLPYLDGYSWNPEVTAHEAGHLYGCGHTQDNVYTINGVPNQPIDGCYPNPGGVVGPIPTDGGTIMSYCHLRPDVGINFDHGFHPIHAAIIRASVYERCTTCGNPGPDDPEPPIVECSENPIFLSLILDAWPEQTSYTVTDDMGDTIHQSPPFTSNQLGAVIYDTLCVTNGCYTYTVTDADGLGPNTEFPCVEGYYYVGDPFGEFGSGQEFTGDTTVQICIGVDPPDPVCYDIVPDSLESYANQDRRGNSTLVDGTMMMSGNNWLAQGINYTITPQTLLVGQVMRGDTGEIHGIGLVDQIAGLNPSNIVRFGGTQRWGLRIDYVPSNEWTDVSIPVGQWLPNITYTYTLFVNDFDREAEFGDARTGFRNMRLCESGAAIVAKAMPEIEGAADDEEWNDSEREMQEWIKDRIKAEYRKPYPSPVTDTLSLQQVDAWFLYSAAGQMVSTGYSAEINMIMLPPGLYFLYVDGVAHKVIKK